ncbi:unnamed protein product [Withania somnifera]
MASIGLITSFASSLVLILSVFLSVHFQLTESQGTQPIVNGLSWNFYDSICPNGCDGSLLLDAPPNLTLRQQTFRIIEDLRRRVHWDCDRVVSCADITAIAARHFSGGQDYDLPLGSRDGLKFATRNEALANLPPPSFNTSLILALLVTKNFTPDVVALSGGHIIGIGHCTSIMDRFYPNQDSFMNKTFSKNLKTTCTMSNSTNTTVLGIRSPNKFDNKYYVVLMNQQGLFTSDQDLYTDKRTRGIVTNFAFNESLFLFEEFVNFIIKMGHLNVLTGTQGEIRATCSVRNSAYHNFLVSFSVGEEKQRTWSEI